MSADDASVLLRGVDAARGVLVGVSESLTSSVLASSRRSSSLVAASSPMVQPPVVLGESFLAPEAIRARSQGWQRKILQYATSVPEVAGAASLVRNSASRVRLVVEGGDEALRLELQARVDGLDLGRLARLVWLSGEAWVVWPRERVAPYSLSVDEVSSVSSSPRVRGASGKMDDLRDPFFRVWQPADLNRFHASSPNEAAIDLVDAMYLHQLADTSVATSRLAGAGILVWPTTRLREGLVDGKPVRGSQEELLKDFSDAALKAISQRSSVEATIPFVVFVDPDQKSFLPEMLRIERDDYAEQYKLRFEEYRLRYATAIDLPIESTTGLGSTNHWSAWAIREDKWREYLAPLLEIIRDAIWRRVILPVDSSMRLMVDANELIAKPDQTATILRLLQLGVIEPAYAFEQLNLDPSRSQPIPERAYSSQQMEGIPSDMTLGGERGGGQFRG